MTDESITAQRRGQNRACRSRGQREGERRVGSGLLDYVCTRKRTMVDPEKGRYEEEEEEDEMEKEEEEEPRCQRCAGSWMRWLRSCVCSSLVVFVGNTRSLHNLLDLGGGGPPLKKSHRLASNKLCTVMRCSPYPVFPFFHRSFSLSTGSYCPAGGLNFFDFPSCVKVAVPWLRAKSMQQRCSAAGCSVQ